jgi:hypothetical protein
MFACSQRDIKQDCARHCTAQKETKQMTDTARPPMAPADPAAYEAWLDQIVPLPEGASLRKVSIDTLKREAKRGKLHIIELSERRRGITRREALKR